MPNHRHRPSAASRARVAELAAGGASVEAIAYAMKITTKAVRDLYAKELQVGPEIAKADLRANLRRLSQGDGVAASHAARALARLESEAAEDDDAEFAGADEPAQIHLPCNARDCAWGASDRRQACPECGRAAESKMTPEQAALRREASAVKSPSLLSDAELERLGFHQTLAERRAERERNGLLGALTNVDGGGRALPPPDVIDLPALPARALTPRAAP